MGREEDTALISENEKWFISTAQMQPELRLDVNIAFLNRAKAAIGSESGGPFLSLLCGCPTLVMGGPDYQKRYEVEENYLKTDCCFLAKKNYFHPYSEVEKHVIKFLEKNKRLSPKKETTSAKFFEGKAKNKVKIQAKNKLEAQVKSYDFIIKDNARRSYEEHYDLMKELFGYEYNKRDPKIDNKKLVGQNCDEFIEVDNFLTKYRQKYDFNCFVELGVHTGASTWLLSRHLKNKATIIGVDSEIFPGCEYSKQVYDLLNKQGFKCHYFVKDTVDAAADVKKSAFNGIDMMHMDANETYDKIKEDWEMYSKFMNRRGIVLMHDIKYVDGVRCFWEEVRDRYEVDEICKGGEGIGIFVVD